MKANTSDQKPKREPNPRLQKFLRGETERLAKQIFSKTVRGLDRDEWEGILDTLGQDTQMYIRKLKTGYSKRGVGVDDGT